MNGRALDGEGGQWETKWDIEVEREGHCGGEGGRGGH